MASSPGSAKPTANQRTADKRDAKIVRASFTPSNDFREGAALDLRSVLSALEADGMLTQTDCNFVLGSNRSREESLMHPISYLARQNLKDHSENNRLLDELRLAEWMASKAGLPHYHIDPMKVPVAETTAIMSFAFARNHHLLCVNATAQEVTIASSEPFKKDWMALLTQTVRQQITRVFALPSEIERYRVEFYSLSKSVSGADSGQKASGIASFEQLLELGTLKDPEANDQHIVNIVDWLLQYAFNQRASDIHIEPRRELARMRFRIDGVLHNIYEFPTSVAIAIVSRLKILGRMNVAEKRKPQDGRIKTLRGNGEEAELRLSTMPTAFGEKLVMRIFDPDVLLRSFEELGLAGDDFERWNGMITKPNGIVLVTGPTGSGKTTTLYSTLKRLATDDVNVSTVEDPIEMVEESFNQTQVQHNIDLDFAQGIKTLMRQDPDIIMVGEIRDAETAKMATQAALTGHLVLSTLHTNDAVSAMTRLLDLGVPDYLLKSTITGVMAQRLVRTLCHHCKAESALSQHDWDDLTKPWKVGKPAKTYEPVGCLECRNTGYLGREGIYEILPITETLYPFVQNGIDLQGLRKQAMREGMRTLRLSGAQRIAQGKTTLAEVLRVAPPE